jgi:hypothetical protein
MNLTINLSSKTFRMWRTLFLFSTSCAMLFIDCNKSDISTSDSEVSSIDTASILPLALGNTWLYRDAALWPDGSLKGFSYDYHRQVTFDTIIRGIRWSVWGDTLHCNDCSTGEWVSNQSSGLWTGWPTENLTYLRLPFPAPVGTQAVSKYEEWTVISQSITITVPAGTFQCYQYRQGAAGGGHDYFFAPGVGMVRFNWYSTTQDSLQTRYIYLQRDLLSFVLR